MDGPKVINELTGQIIGAAITVHRALGPGLLESAYQSCLVTELERSGLVVVKQVSMPLFYKNLLLDKGYVIDLLVQDTVVVELKAVETLLPVHHSQVLTYVKLSGKNVGLLLNFNVVKLTDGIVRFVNKI
jgi:GxxExxY protein